MPKGKEEQYFDFPVTDAKSRSTNSPVQYEEGGQVQSIYEKNQAKRDELKKKSAEAEKQRQKRKADRKDRRDARRAKRAKRKSDKNKKKIENLESKKGVEVTTTAKNEEDKKNLDYSGKLKDKKNIKKVEVTKGGAYPTYEKDTKQAKSFNEAFAAARKAQGPGGTFEWNGRKYTTDRADDKPKDKPEAKPKDKPKDKKPKTKSKSDNKVSEMPKKDVEDLDGVSEASAEDLEAASNIALENVRKYGSKVAGVKLTDSQKAAREKNPGWNK